MIEIGSFIALAAMNRSSITIKDVAYDELGMIPDVFKKLGVELERRGDDIVLNMPSSVTFGFDSSDLTVQARNALNDVANILTQYTDTRVNIVGHTDSTGSVSYNQQLSERRAEAVGNYLAQSGVMRNRLYMTGSGPHQPVASNATEEGRAQNRRVEITLSPIQEQFQ